MGYLRKSPLASKVRDNLVDQALRTFHLLARERQRSDEPHPSRVVTISRQLGSGGKRIAEVLSAQLGWPLYDREILDVLAHQSGAGYHAEMFESLDERVKSDIEMMVDALFGRVDQHRYFFLLPRAILTLAQNDCVLLGRGAHLLLPGALKLRIEASLETRIANMVRFEGMTEHEAKRAIMLSDHSRERFLDYMMTRMIEPRQWFKHRQIFDLTVNTDHFGIDEAAAVLVEAVRQRFNKGSRLKVHGSGLDAAVRSS